MAAQRETEKGEWLQSENTFRTNADKIIAEMLELWSTERSDYTTALLEEVLHSIFFLGKVHNPTFSPDTIVNDKDMLEELKKTCPLPFKLYCSQLPKRSPFSCVLDMIVHLNGENNENKIKGKLQKLNCKLSRGRKVKHLISSTVCVSQNTEISDSSRYYGVSMSTSGGNAGQIMLAASCLTYWDNYVADAVMTYFPGKAKNKDFDGTIKLPKTVRCQAFTMRNGANVPPCKSCEDLFGLHATVEKTWVYGNCAEVESVSNLFKNEERIKEQARPTSEKYTDQNRHMAKMHVLTKLKGLLKHVGFKWDNKFYPNTEVNLKRKFS